MSIPRRSFLTGLLALPAAVLPKKAEVKWIEAKTPAKTEFVSDFGTIYTYGRGIPNPTTKS